MRSYLHLFGMILCLLIFRMPCGLSAAVQYSDVSAPVKVEIEPITEALPDADVISPLSGMFETEPVPEKTPVSGQPLPGTLLTVLLGAAMTAFLRKKRAGAVCSPEESRSGFAAHPTRCCVRIASLCWKSLSYSEKPQVILLSNVMLRL